ncbi:MAG: amidohydrolase family protein [Hyphomicrobiales bacterium]
MRGDSTMMDERRLILEGANLIDGSGGAPIRDAMIVIEGNRIRYAGGRTDRFNSGRARRWRLHGKTVTPGLIEAHTHAAFDGDMRAYVKNGITTIRFAGFDQTSVDRLSKRINDGELRGPRILSCGPMIDQPPAAYPEWSIEVDTPAEAAAAAERLIAEHDLHSLILTQRVTKPVMRAVIEVAHAHERLVVAQTWDVDGAEAAELGIDELHTGSRVCASPLYPRNRLLRYASIPERLALASRLWAAIDWELTQPIIDAMIVRRVVYCGMQVITQYQIGEGISELEEDPDFRNLFSDEEKTAFRKFTQRLQGGWTPEDVEFGRVANEQRAEWLRRYHRAGGRIIVGTDMQFGGIMLHRELKNLEGIGMSRLEVIAAATGAGARALHLDSKLGLVRENRLADLLVLNRDPLQDLSALRDIACVIQDGVVAWSDRRAEFAHDNANTEWMLR